MYASLNWRIRRHASTPSSTGSIQVEHDHRGVELACERDGLLAVGDERHFETFAFQVRPDELGERLLVIDDEHAATGDPRAARRGRIVLVAAHSEMATNVPCHLWFQTAPEDAVTENIPTILPCRSISMV